MSYTAPAGNAVDFTFDGASYTAPAGGAIELDFSAASTPSLTCSGAIALPGEASLSRGVVFSCVGAIAFGGSATLNHSGPLEFSGVGAISLGGAATLESVTEDARFLRCAGNIVLGGRATLAAGRSFGATGKVKLGGRAAFNTGRTLAGNGFVCLSSGAAQFRHGQKLSALGPIAIGGETTFSALPSFSLTCTGKITLFGGARFDIKRNDFLPSLSIKTRPAEVLRVVG